MKCLKFVSPNRYIGWTLNRNYFYKEMDTLLRGKFRERVYNFGKECVEEIQKTYDFSDECFLVVTGTNDTWNIYVYKDLNQACVDRVLYRDDFVNAIYINFNTKRYMIVMGKSCNDCVFDKISKSDSVFLNEYDVAYFLNNKKYTNITIVPMKRRPGRDTRNPECNENENCIVFSKKEDSEFRSDIEFIKRCKEKIKRTKYRSKENLVTLMVSDNNEPGIKYIIVYEDIDIAKKEFDSLRYSNNVIMTKW